MTGEAPDSSAAHHPRERMFLQAAIVIACFVPLLAGGSGVLGAADFLAGDNPMSRHLDSHFRYLSGLLLGIGLLFLSCVPKIEERTARFQALGIVVMIGGLARLYAASLNGMPSGGHVFGLVMELGVVPALMLWQRNYAWRARRALIRRQAGAPLAETPE